MIGGSGNKTIAEIITYKERGNRRNPALDVGTRRAHTETRNRVSARSPKQTNTKYKYGETFGVGRRIAKEIRRGIKDPNDLRKLVS